MANSRARTAEDRGGVSLYLRRSYCSAALAVLAHISASGDAVAQQLTLGNPRDLLVGEPAAVVEALEAARPAPVPPEAMAAILKTLPAEGEVTKLTALEQRKVDAVRQLLRTTRRDWYEIRVVDIRSAAVALYARAVVLISAPAIALLSAGELQALAAHEIGHEYFWAEWNHARQGGDQARLKQLELVCDAIGSLTLEQLGFDPSQVTDAIEKVTRFNRRHIGAAINDANYPSLAERRAFGHETLRWLRKWRGVG